MAVREGDRVVLLVGDDWYMFAEAHRKREVKVTRQARVNLAPVIGRPWGAIYEVVRNKLVPVSKDYAAQLGTELSTADLVPEEDNRGLVDDNTAQKLTADEIMAMKRQGVRTDELISKLVENSKSFETKTGFAKEKYVARKQKKHMVLVRVLQPTPRTVATALSFKQTQQILFLREDILGLALNFANVRAGGSTLVYDAATGLMVASALFRMGESGVLLHVHDTPGPRLGTLDRFNFTPPQRKRLRSVHCSQLALLYAGAEDDPVLPAAGADSLLVAAPGNGDVVLAGLWDHLAPSAAFAVYSPTLESLAEAQQWLGRGPRAVAVQLVELWTRPYQVLAQRTHPDMSPQGSSGFLLRGYKVLADPSAPTGRAALPAVPAGTVAALLGSRCAGAAAATAARATGAASAGGEVDDGGDEDSAEPMDDDDPAGPAEAAGSGDAEAPSQTPKRVKMSDGAE